LDTLKEPALSSREIFSGKRNGAADTKYDNVQIQSKPNSPREFSFCKG